MKIGTALTNLTSMKFTKMYGDLELDRLILQPGGGFPLATVGLVIGAVTCVNKLSLTIEYAEETISTKLAQRITKIAIKLLLGKFTEVIMNGQIES